MDKLIKKCISAAKKKLGIKPNSKTLVHSISSFQGSTDLITRHRIADDTITFACKKGCAHCCSLRVEVLPPEAFYIARYIKSLPLPQQQIHVKNLESHTAYSQGRPFADYHKACPFLTEHGACGIYAVRPHKCRSNLSTQVESCITTGNPVENPQLKAAHSRLALETISVYKNKKCIMHPTELGLGVLAALTDETLEIKWASGMQVFELLPEKIML